jgi:16S rRNA (uracil1498-N3)-methyltransferase
VKMMLLMFLWIYGGFSEAEKISIKKSPNVISINLGDRILRAETAVSSVLSLVQGFLNN